MATKSSGSILRAAALGVLIFSGFLIFFMLVIVPYLEPGDRPTFRADAWVHEQAMARRMEEVRKIEEENERRASTPLTLSNYYQLQSNMTYEEVIAIVGPPSREVSRNFMEGVQGVMSSVETVMYVWEETWGANMNAIFQNGRLRSKAQFGLR